MNRDQHFGGGKVLEISADAQLSRHAGIGSAWTWQVTATTTGLAVRLPDARTVGSSGYPVVQIVNEGANAFAVEDADGTELVASGDNPTDTVLTFALFDMSTAAGDWEWGTWTQGAGAPPPPTTYPWTVGGNNPNMDSNAFRYDFVADSWSEPGGTSSNQFVGGCAGFAIQGVAYVTNASGVTDSFDPTSWSTTPTDLGASALNGWGAAHETDDKGYVMGSFGFSAASDQCVEYDQSANAWTALTDIPAIRHKANCATISSNRIAYCGGATNFGATHLATTAARIYDIVGDSHSVVTSMTNARELFGCTYDGDRELWAYSGATGGGASLAFTDAVEKYDDTADSWSIQNDFPDTNYHVGATRIAINGYNYCVGGAGTVTNPDANRQHVPTNDVYTALTDHSIGAEVAGVSQGNTATLID